MAEVKDNVLKILSWLPGYVELVAAAKSRSVEEILEAIDSGVRIVGENYVQEAEEKFSVIGTKARWHFIGHLQKNKVKKAVKIFDMIETVDSVEIAQEINKSCASINKIMPVLIEVNSHVLPSDTETIINNISGLPNIKLAGLMTMGPVLENPEDYRPYFKETKALFDKIRINHDIKYLSMGMSDSYPIAIQEGANLVRLGTALFGGPRKTP
jgi:pyridoxal phosphate enzyme (YggS family)